MEFLVACHQTLLFRHGDLAPVVVLLLDPQLMFVTPRVGPRDLWDFSLELLFDKCNVNTFGACW